MDKLARTQIIRRCLGVHICLYVREHEIFFVENNMNKNTIKIRNAFFTHPRVSCYVVTYNTIVLAL